MLRLPNVRKLLLASSFAVLFLLCTGVTRADSLFNGSYAVGNWTTTLTNSDGGVNTAGAPTSILLTGGNNGSEASGETLFSISVPTTTTLTFGWTYTTYDCCGSEWDPAGYEIDGTQFQLSPPSSVTGFSGSGVQTVNLVAGEQFGFYVDTADNIQGPGTLAVGPATGTPEPSSLALLAAGLLGLAGLFRRGCRQLG
jgi:hypothetical protein